MGYLCTNDILLQEVFLFNNCIILKLLKNWEIVTLANLFKKKKKIIKLKYCMVLKKNTASIKIFKDLL